MKYDVIVIGGGVSGLSTARALRARGVGRVLLAERGLIAHPGATPRAAGMVLSSSWSMESIHLAIRSQAILADVAARSNQAFQYVKSGYVLLLSEVQRPMAEWISGNINAAGGNSRMIGRDELAAMYPALRTDDVDAAMYNADDAVVHPLQMAMAMAGLARREGVEFAEGAPVDRLQVSDGRVTGAYVHGERVAADHVVVAAGIHTRRILLNSGFDIPLKAFRTQVSVVPTPADWALPGMTDVMQGVYGAPRVKGGYLFGYGTQTENIDPVNWNPVQDADEEADALERFHYRFPSLAGVRPIGGWAGICDIAPDSHPLIGPFRAEGLHVLAGLAGHGLPAGPAAGEVVADFIVGREPSLPVAGYYASRYADYDGEEWPITFGGPWRISKNKNQR